MRRSLPSSLPCPILVLTFIRSSALIFVASAFVQLGSMSEEFDVGWSLAGQPFGMASIGFPAAVEQHLQPRPDALPVIDDECSKT